jgi:hypothetical protein
MQEKYICSIHISTILDVAIDYWELKNKNTWVVLGNNIAYRAIEDIQETICVYTYPNEGKRISYTSGDLNKSAWIHTNESGNYYLTPRSLHGKLYS